MFFWLLVSLLAAGLAYWLWHNKGTLTFKMLLKTIALGFLLCLLGSLLIMADYANFFGRHKDAEWFPKARFGVFIHWGHVSQQGWELSWPMMTELPNLPYSKKVTREEYNRHALDFNPVKFDPQDMARRIKNMGAQYVVVIAKHHDGFNMYPTKYTDWSIAKAKYGKDIVGPLVRAVRAEGMHPGIYYSLCDWHYPAYPTYDWRKGGNYSSLRWASWGDWNRYITFMFGQIRELLTNYGQIDVLWFDGGWEVVPWRLHPYALKNMIKKLQPQIMINDRLLFAGGYKTPEQFIPQKPLKGPWETCLTMNTSWGYIPADRDYKSVYRLIRTICEVASKGGNLLLNISPRGDGTLPPEQIERMAAIGRWMKVYGGSIIGTEPGLEPWQFYGPSTRKGNKYYLHLVMRPAEEITVRGIKINRVKSVTALKDGRPLKWTKQEPVLDMILKDKDPTGELTIKTPPAILDPYVSVIALEFLQ